MNTELFQLFQALHGQLEPVEAKLLFKTNGLGIQATTVYDSEKDMFIPPQPYPSWTLDSNGNWNAPVAPPTKDYAGSNVNEAVDRSWDEDNQQWIGIDYEDSTNYIWNTTTSDWETA